MVRRLRESEKNCVNTSCTGHRWRKRKNLFVFCSGKNLLSTVSWFLFFFLLHLCPVHEVNAKTFHSSPSAEGHQGSSIKLLALLVKVRYIWPLWRQPLIGSRQFCVAKAVSLVTLRKGKVSVVSRAKRILCTSFNIVRERKRVQEIPTGR